MTDELISLDFSDADKESLLRVMRKYKSAPPHHDEVASSLAVPGPTILTEMEARYLAGIVRPYYAYLSDRIEAHPLLNGQPPPAPATGTVAVLREALEGLDGEMRVVLSRDAEGNGYSPFADSGVLYYSPSAGEVCDQDEMTEYGQHDSRPALVLWPVG